MKTLLAFTGSVAFSALLLAARAQAPATSHDNPTPAKPTKPGPAIEQGSKKLGRKMVQKSKPTDMTIPPPTKPRKLD